MDHRYQLWDISSLFSLKSICQFGLFQNDAAICLNDCVILGRFLPNRVAIYLVTQELLLSQLYRNSD